MRSPKSIWLAPLLFGCLACAHCSDSGAGKEEPSDASASDAASPSDAKLQDAPSASDASDVGRDAGSSDAGSAGGLDAGMSDAGRDAGANTSDASARDAQADAAPSVPAHTFVYVGGYSDSDPLRAYEINRATLALTPIAQDAAVGPQPSYITPSADGRTLYVANEDDQATGITVLRVNESTGVPTRIDHEDAVSKSYVFSALTPDGKYLLATSYNGGDIGVYPVKADGTLDPRVDMRSFGAGAQAHSVRIHPGGWVYVPTKGLDSVAQLKIDGAGKLTDLTFEAFPTPGLRSMFDGPRHIAFSRDQKRAFVILELGDALISLAVADNGVLSELDRKPRRPTNSGMANDTGAHVLAHPTKNFVYGSNRGTNTLAAFSYDDQGKLTLLGHVDSRGKTPRDFDIDPLGQFLIVANEDSGTLAVFAIEADGKLTPKGAALTGLASPAAVAIVGL
jgi:6-phosphogluconolactonase